MLTMKEHLASGNEAMLHNVIIYLFHVCDPQNQLLLMKGLQPCSMGLPWTFTSVTCDQRKEGGSSVMALLQ